jgi:hypothetical protein
MTIYSNAGQKARWRETYPIGIFIRSGHYNRSRTGRPDYLSEPNPGLTENFLISGQMKKIR